MIDSPFYNLKNSIKLMVNSQMKGVPDFVVDLTLSQLEKDIAIKTGIVLSNINPLEYVESVPNSVCAVIGTKDHMLELDKFIKMYEKFPGKIKKLKMFQGTHQDVRPKTVLSDVFKFINHVQGLNQVHYQRRMQPHSLNELSYLDYSRSISMISFNK